MYKTQEDGWKCGGDILDEKRKKKFMSFEGFSIDIISEMWHASQSVFVEVKLSCKGVGWASVEAGVDFC